MNLSQILADLAKIRRQIRIVVKPLREKTIQEYHLPCPDPFCHDPKRRTFRVMTLHALSFSVRRLEEFTASHQTLVPVQRNFQIMDGWCDRCDYDWHAVMHRMERESHSLILAGIRPQMLFTNPCPNCLEHAVYGFFRAGYCTGGICVTCKYVLGPTDMVQPHVEANKKLRHALKALLVQREKLIAQAREMKGYSAFRRRILFFL